MSWAITPRWLVAADGNLTLWNEYYPRDALMSGPLRDRALSASAGGEFVAGPELLTPKYWETIHWRIGARYTEMPITTAYEYAFSIGTGLPLPRGGGLLDVVVEYGLRHDDSYTAYREDFLRLCVGINGGRKWTKSPQDSY